MDYALLGDDLAAIAHTRFDGAKISTMQKKALLDGERVLPATAQMCSYVQTQTKDGNSTGVPDDPKWWAKLCRLCGFPAEAVVALAVKADFENWYALEVLRPSGAWSGDVELGDAMSVAPPSSDRFSAFESAYRAELRTKVLALLSAFGPFPDYPKQQAGVEELVASALSAGWYKRRVFPDGRPEARLLAAVRPPPGMVERKACVPKPEAAAIISRLLAPRLGITGSAMGLPELLRSAKTASFLKDEKSSKNGETVEPAEWAAAYPSKDSFLVVQASVVVISDREFVPTVIREDKDKNGGKIERLSPDESFLLSVSPEPDGDLVKQIRSMLGRKFCHEASAAPLRPLGFLVNLISTKAGEISDGDKAPRDRAFFAIAVWAAEITGKPRYATKVPTNTGEWDRAGRWGTIRSLRVSDLPNYGDRAILHALKHPGKCRVVGNGSAWFIDASHEANADWKTALALPDSR